MTESDKGDVSLLPCDPRRERVLLERWLHAPHVTPWWGDPDQAMREILLPAPGGGDALILFGATAVGYLRWQRPSRDELDAAGLHDIADDTIDVDIAIGEPDCIGRGVASQALRLLVRHLRSTASMPSIMMCTSVKNAKAIRAFERAGFSRDRIFADPQFGPMWLFVMRPAADSRGAPQRSSQPFRRRRAPERGV